MIYQIYENAKTGKATINIKKYQNENKDEDKNKLLINCLKNTITVKILILILRMN